MMFINECADSQQYAAPHKTYLRRCVPKVNSMRSGVNAVHSYACADSQQHAIQWKLWHS